jgi:hypothetical protein
VVTVKLNGSRIPVDAEAALLMAGGSSMVTTFDGSEAADVPAALVAVTVKEYMSPPVSPVTVSGLAAPLAVWPPFAGLVASVAVTVYEVIADPPSEAGGDQDTVADPFPAAALTPAGEPGATDPAGAA